MEDPRGSGKEAEGEWEVVRSRKKGKPRAKQLSRRSGEDGHLSCCPGHGPASDLTSGDAEEEPRLRARLHKSMERVRTSLFFQKLVEQIQGLQIFETLLANARISRNPHLGPSAGTTNSVDHEASDAAMEVVVLGVGSILDSEVSRCQMGLALLMKERFSCIGEILVHDPVLSALECGFLRNLGCTPIVRDEEGRRRGSGPTLFYMPHCGASLYNSVLEENLDPWRLGWISILGNSFQRYQDSWSVFPKPKHARPDCLLGIQPHVTEHPVNAASFPCMSAFNDMSWHLYPIDKISL